MDYAKTFQNIAAQEEELRVGTKHFQKCDVTYTITLPTRMCTYMVVAQAGHGRLGIIL